MRGRTRSWIAGLPDRQRGCRRSPRFSHWPRLRLLYGAFGNKDALFGQCLDRYASNYGAQYEQALAAHPGDPVRAVEAFFDVILGRIADPSVPVGCLIAQSAAQTNPREPRTPTHRVRAISMRAERLQPAEHAVHQLALDSRDGKAHDLEAALDRDRYGPATDGNATTYRTVGKCRLAVK